MEGDDTGPGSTAWPLFVYGTLCTGATAHGLTRAERRAPALLPGRRGWLPEGYPIVSTTGPAGAWVRGELLWASAWDWKALDAYEGGDYLRVLATAWRGARTPIRAWVYVASPSGRLRAGL